jgi:hypothetical protein
MVFGSVLFFPENDHTKKICCNRSLQVQQYVHRTKDSNLDPLTETYSIAFYLQYLAQWPDYFVIAENANSKLMGYGTSD